MIRDARSPLAVWVPAGLLALLLIAAPLPFGGVVPWAVAVLGAGAFAALGCALLAGPRPRDLAAVRGPVLALAALAALGFVQSLPWPAGVARWLSPRHVLLAESARTLLRGEEVPVATTLSLAPELTRTVALEVLAVAAVLLAGAALGGNRPPRRLLAGAVLVGALFQGLYGAAQWLAGSRTIWGVSVQSDSSRLRGTFVNPNHLALYFEIALCITLAYGWWALRRARTELHIERKLLWAGPPAVLWVVLFVSLAFTGSRAGMLAALAGVFVQAIALSRARGNWGPALWGGALAVAGVVAVVVIGLRQGFGRFLSDVVGGAALGTRARTWAAAGELWQSFPVLGTGLGTFREAFPLVQPTDLPGNYWHAESDLLELLVTSGIAGAGLVLAGAVWLARRLYRGLLHGRRSEDRATALAGLGAMASVGLHELVDFGLTMPGNSLTLAALLGAAAAVRTAGEASAQSEVS